MKIISRTLIAIAALAGSLAVSQTPVANADGACLQNAYNGGNILSTFVTADGIKGGAILCRKPNTAWFSRSVQRFTTRVATVDAWAVDALCVTVRPVVTVKATSYTATRYGKISLNCTGTLTVPKTRLPSGLVLDGVIYDISMYPSDVTNKAVITSGKLELCVTNKYGTRVRPTEGSACKTLNV